jgi:SAM-dependent methyltransferase
MIKKTIKNFNTFRFFNYKWKKVPSWGAVTAKQYTKWYLKRYGFKNIKTFKKFINNKKLILDAGCGLARDSVFFSKLNKKGKIFAIDQSKFVINYNKKKLAINKNLHFYQRDITKKLNFQKKFDFISCDQVIHHTPDIVKTIKNLIVNLKKEGSLFFFVCKQKNYFRDLVDDYIMDSFKNKSPDQLWKFATIVTKFGKAIHNLNLKEIRTKNKIYKNLQEIVHYHLFRCWYNPKIPFKLSVSSNYDWFSNNPRYSLNEIKSILNQIKKKYKNIKVQRIYSDDASISVRLFLK